MSSRATFPAAVYLCLRRDDDVLLLRRKNTGYRDGEWSLPAGHIEFGESATAALIRETREEILVDLSPEDLSPLVVQHGRIDGDAYLDLFFAADGALLEPRIGEPDKCSELLWARFDDLPSNVVPAVANALAAARRHDWYAEIGWD